ncbi:MAG: hypothetical protein ACTSR3_11080 [Candidatus Helarchaeota archaeon]
MSDKFNDLIDKRGNKYFAVSVLHTEQGDVELEEVYSSDSEKRIDNFIKETKLENPNLTFIKTHLKSEDFVSIREFCQKGNLNDIIRVLHNNDKDDFLAKFPFRVGWIFEHVLNRVLFEKNILKKNENYLKEIEL